MLIFGGVNLSWTFTNWSFWKSGCQMPQPIIYPPLKKSAATESTVEYMPKTGSHGQLRRGRTPCFVEIWSSNLSGNHWVHWSYGPFCTVQRISWVGKDVKTSRSPTWRSSSSYVLGYECPIWKWEIIPKDWRSIELATGRLNQSLNQGSLTILHYALVSKGN